MKMKNRIIRLLGGATKEEISKLYEMNIKLEDALYEERIAHDRTRSFFGNRETSSKEKNDYFMVEQIARDFKTIFLELITSRSKENDWTFESEVHTNKLQDEIYFSQKIIYGKTSNFQTVCEDIEAAILYMREIGYKFNVRTIKRATLIEFTKLRLKRKKQ